MVKLSCLMEAALIGAYESSWPTSAWVCSPGTRWVTIKALRSRGLCRGDGELTPDGNVERERLLAELADSA